MLAELAKFVYIDSMGIQLEDFAKWEVHIPKGIPKYDHYSANSGALILEWMNMQQSFSSNPLTMVYFFLYLHGII